MKITTLKMALPLMVMGVIFALALGLLQMRSKAQKLQAELVRQQELVQAYVTLANSRRAQLDELHALILAHNNRWLADQATLEDYQHKIGELEDYLNTQMADSDAIFLDDRDVERLRQVWHTPTSPDPD